MGIAVPSAAEASRRLPSSVKADLPDADDVRVTSVAIVPPAIDEPVSPELALVDPDLAARLRALLPDIEIEPPEPVLRALPDPEPPALPLPELVPAPVEPRLVYVYPSRRERLLSFAKAFALGAAAATVVTVGVVSETSDGPSTVDAGTTPPRTTAPVTEAPSGGAAGTPPATTAAGRAAGVAGAGAAKATQTKRPQVRGAGPKAASGAAATSGKATGSSQGSKPKPAPAAPAAESRRFAWAPVEDAVGYRFELFRGDKQVLETRTSQPAYELAGSWQHDGQTESLDSGEYRWYVWPIFSSGPAAQAVVQAKLSIP
jgi:hypothetical protein